MKNGVVKNNRRLLKEKQLLAVNVIVFFVLRFLVIICMVAQSIHGNWNNVFLCILTLILFTFPVLIQKTLKVEFPKTLEIIIYLFIFSSEILGEIQNFYGVFIHWDTMLHTLNGFLCAAVGFCLVDLLNRRENSINMTPAFLAVVSFCFSMTTGVLWEFFEYGMDIYLKQDMQKDRIIKNIDSKEIGDKKSNETVHINDINKTIIFYNDNKQFVIQNGYLDIGVKDTMKDLLVNFIGALIFSILGFLYVKDRDEYKFIERFIPIVKKLKE